MRDTAVLISDKQTTIQIDLILQDKPNHTTYGHSQESHMATFHESAARITPTAAFAPGSILP